jgi:hypothetical protein
MRKLNPDFHIYFIIEKENHGLCPWFSFSIIKEAPFGG